MRTFAPLANGDLLVPDDLDRAAPGGKDGWIVPTSRDACPDPKAPMHNQPMDAAAMLDLEAIARACKRYGVVRLSVFGSALTDAFDPEGSDIDFLVDFVAGNPNLFNDYFDLKFELERITGRPVDLVDASAIRNPFFRASALETAQELYSA